MPEQALVAHTFSSSIWKAEASLKMKASLGSTVSARLAWATRDLPQQTSNSKNREMLCFCIPR